MATVPFYIPVNSTNGFQFFHILVNTSFYSSQPKECEVVSHCVLISVSIMISDVEIFFFHVFY